VIWACMLWWCLTAARRWAITAFFAHDEQRLAKRCSSWAKKQLGSRNRDQACRNVARLHARLHARIHARIADRRTDFLHKLSTGLIRENQTICLEGLQVKAMGKHPTLAKASSAVGWGAFVRMLDYKAGW
jgi:putative transposase